MNRSEKFPGQEGNGNTGADKDFDGVAVGVAELEEPESLLHLVGVLGSKRVTLASITDLRHKTSPSVGAPSGAGLNNHEPTDGDTGPAGDPLQSPAGHPPRFPFARHYEYTPGDKSGAHETSPAAQAGAGKGGSLVPPTAGASTVRPGEVPPIASPGQHGKQFLVEPDADMSGLFNVDCGKCGEGRTLDPNSLALFLSIHDCGLADNSDQSPLHEHVKFRLIIDSPTAECHYLLGIAREDESLDPDQVARQMIRALGERNVWAGSR